MRNGSINPGHINHSLFWENLAPASGNGGKLESGALKSAIERDFGSVESFKTSFNTKTAAIQGSGWGWLVNFAFVFLYHASSQVKFSRDIIPRQVSSRL